MMTYACSGHDNSPLLGIPSLENSQNLTCMIWDKHRTLLQIYVTLTVYVPCSMAMQEDYKLNVFTKEVSLV